MNKTSLIENIDILESCVKEINKVYDYSKKLDSHINSSLHLACVHCNEAKDILTAELGRQILRENKTN